MSRPEGSCACGHIAFVVEDFPNNVTNCHCRMCQKASGAPYVTWAEFPASAVTWKQAEPTWRASSDMAERGFCPQCGTPVAFRYNAGQDIDLPSALFDDPETFPPQDELWTASRRSWSRLNPNLTHHAQDRVEGK